VTLIGIPEKVSMNGRSRGHGGSAYFTTATPLAWGQGGCSIDEVWRPVATRDGSNESAVTFRAPLKHNMETMSVAAKIAYMTSLKNTDAGREGQGTDDQDRGQVTGTGTGDVLTH